MANIELVIKMPESIWVAIQNGEYCGILDDRTYNAIKNGTPLPKGHGRLIDADALKMDKRVCGDMYLSKTSLFVANKIIEQADTIIEADKEQEDDKI